MKQGWEIKKLGEVCDIINGRNQKLVECVDGEYPIYGSGGVMGYASQFLCKAGTTIIGRKGTINKPIYVEEPFWNVDTAFGLQPKNTLNNKLLHYFCHYFDFLKLNKGTTIPSLVKADLLQIPIPVPSLAEQERIVEILDREFERIDALKANAEQNLQHAIDLFQAALKQELQPKEGWIVSTLQALLRLTSGDNLTAKSIVQGEYPVYGGNGIMGYHNQYNLDGLNVIVGRVGALCGNVRLVKGKIWYTDNAFLVHDKENVFYLPYLTYELQRADLRQYATQAAQPVVSNASMKDVVLAAPATKEEQELIVARLDKLNEHCTALEENYKKTIALCDDMKQALLRKAFNGEL